MNTSGREYSFFIELCIQFVGLNTALSVECSKHCAARCPPISQEIKIGSTSFSFLLFISSSFSTTTTLPTYARTRSSFFFSFPQQRTTHSLDTHSLSISPPRSHIQDMATQQLADPTTLSKDQQQALHQDEVLAELEIAGGAKPVVPPHLLARLTPHDTPDK